MTASTGTPYADLHVHTTRSDGALDPAAVPAAAARAGVSVVAITDHDVLAPFDGPALGGASWTEIAASLTDGDRGTAEPGERTVASADGPGATLVAGIELRVSPADGADVDLLGYGLRRTDDLVAEIDRIQANRRERGRAIVECVEDRLRVDLDVSIGTGFGRPHVARAVDAHPETDLDYQDAFDELIGSDEPCYVAREIPSFDRGRRLLAEACDVVALAHPLRYRDPAAALDRVGALDAVELAYPYGRDVDRRPVERAIERHDLLATGGSDAHDDRLGLAGLDREEYERLAPPAWNRSG